MINNMLNNISDKTYQKQYKKLLGGKLKKGIIF